MNNQKLVLFTVLGILLSLVIVNADIVYTPPDGEAPEDLPINSETPALDSEASLAIATIIVVAVALIAWLVIIKIKKDNMDNIPSTKTQKNISHTSKKKK